MGDCCTHHVASKAHLAAVALAAGDQSRSGKHELSSSVSRSERQSADETGGVPKGSRQALSGPPPARGSLRGPLWAALHRQGR